MVATAETVVARVDTSKEARAAATLVAVARVTVVVVSDYHVCALETYLLFRRLLRRRRLRPAAAAAAGWWWWPLVNWLWYEQHNFEF